MSKKGFTLVELLGVLVILAVIVLVAFPNILSAFKKTDTKMNEATKTLLETNARSYVTAKGGKVSCVNISTLIEEDYTATPIANVSKEKATEIETSWSVALTYSTDGKVKEAKIQEHLCS